jgi:tetratricopeptide (TPR) repeat protein
MTSAFFQQPLREFQMAKGKGQISNGSENHLPFAIGCLPFAIFLLCFLRGLPAPSADQWDGESLETGLAEGIDLLNKGRFLESVWVLNSVKQSASQDARPYFYCGMALAQAGRMRDAASELGEAVHLAPGQLDYRVFQAHVLEQLKQAAAAQDALAVFQKEQTAERLEPAWLRLLADVYYRLQLTDQALKVLDLWAKRDPADARIDLYRGQVYVVKGQPVVALSCFQRSLEKSAENPQAYFELGTLLYEKNELLPAKNALLSAVREDANNPEYRSKLASVYLALGDAGAAIECLKTVEPAGSKIPMIYYVLGRAYRSKGNSARAGEYMEKFQEATSAEREHQAQTLEVERPIAQAQRALDQGNSEAARALFQKALQADPNRWEPNAYLAEMHLNSGDLRGAYTYLQKLEQIDPDSAVGNFLMARYWFKLKDYDQARRYAEKVKLSRPDNSELRALLGEIYAELGEKQKASQEYEAAIHLAPERADLRDRLRKVTGGGPQEKSQP